MKHSVRFKGHESFILREGWLNKGLREVKKNPKVFFENYGADALGVGPNMAKSIRYWMKCSGLTDERVRTITRLTDLGEMILQKDPYLEEMFSLWVIHCNIARNRELATVWQIFFNEFDYEEFTREELEQKMLELAARAAGTQTFSKKSVKDDCEAVLRMYLKKQTGSSNPEEKNVSPFGELGLLKETEDGYAREQPGLHKLPPEILLYLISGMEGAERGISMEDLLQQPGGPGRILHLRRTGLMELLEQIEGAGKVVVNRTAGLDMVYLSEQTAPEQVVQKYYFPVGDSDKSPSKRIFGQKSNGGL